MHHGTQLSYGLGADAYERRSRQVERLTSTPWVMLARRLDLSNSAPLDVLDVGGGPGLDAEALGELGHRVTLLEPVPEFAERARTHQRADRVIELPAEKMVFPDASFDLVSCINVLHHLEESAARTVLASMVRALRPGALLVLSTEEGTGERNEPAPWGGARYYRGSQLDDLIGTLEGLVREGLGVEVLEADRNTSTRPFVSLVAQRT